MSFARTLATASLVVLLALLIFILDRFLLAKKRRDWIWVALLLTLLVGNSMALYPVVIIPVNNPTKMGNSNIFAAIPGSPVVIVTDRSIQQGRSFEDTDWAYCWGNLIEQEMGFCSFTSIENFKDFLQDSEVVILTRSACREISGDDASKLEDWVRSGGLALFELPGDTLVPMTGFSIDVESEWGAEKFTGINTPGGSSWTDICDIPLSTSCYELSGADSGLTIVLEIDEKPAVIWRNFGDGVVLAFLFDVGRELVALQQGVPDTNFRIHDKRGSDGIVDTADLLFSSSMMNSTVPYADLLERWIMALIEDHVVFPRIWYFPYQWDGIVCMSHDEDWYGDDSVFVSALENEKGYNSTFFVIPDGPITTDGVTQITELGSEVQIHWNRETYRWMIFFKREDGSLETQKDILEGKLENGMEISICRLERVRWGDHYTMPFRIMEAQGIELDSSFGSAGKMGKGYMHATGLPFHPLDTNGLPFGLYELPFQIQAQYSGIDTEFIRDLLLGSQREHHEIINSLYHPKDLEEGKPSRVDWLKFDKLAMEHNHGMMTLSEVLRWWELRRETKIVDCTWDEGTLRATLDFPASSMAVFIPSSYRSLPLSGVLIDGERAVSSREVALHGKGYTLIKMEPGLHEIQAHYSV